MANLKEIDYALYLCTDSQMILKSKFQKTIEEAILGGVTVIQIREKEKSTKDFYELAFLAKKVTDKYHVPLIINDRLDIMLALDASGIHLGSSDLNPKIARKIIGKDKIIGYSATNLSEALLYQDDIDYLGVGAVYETNTKTDAKVVSIETLKAIISSVKLPVVAIGGINEFNLGQLKGIGLRGIAVVSAILKKDNIQKAAEELKKLWIS